MKLSYQKGDVTKFTQDGTVIIPHCVNDLGVMGSGVARALFVKWPYVRQDYIEWFKEGKSEYSEVSGPPQLGHIQSVCVQSEPNIFVINMVGQRDVCDFHDLPPVRYQSLKECLWRLRDWLEENKLEATVVAPKFGSDLAGGDWNLIEKIIHEVFGDSQYDWVIYEFEAKHENRINVN